MGDWKLHFCKTGWNPDGSEGNESTELFNLRDDVGETKDLLATHPEIVAQIEVIADEFRHQLGDQRLGHEGTEIRPIGECPNPKPLTEYDENHPYMVACYDLADSQTMFG